MSFGSYAGSQVCSYRNGHGLQRRMMSFNAPWRTWDVVFLPRFWGKTQALNLPSRKKKKTLLFLRSACHLQWLFLLLSEASGRVELAVTIADRIFGITPKSGEEAFLCMLCAGRFQASCVRVCLHAHISYLNRYLSWDKDFTDHRCTSHSQWQKSLSLKLDQKEP